MIYFDTSYLARLYLEDAGWEQVRELAATTTVACCLHGRAETVAVFHRKPREGTLTLRDLTDLLNQFDSDCAADAVTWLPLTPAVIARVTKIFAARPKSVALRSGDAIHLACAAEKGLREIYSNDRHFSAAASYFDLTAVNIF